MKIRLITAIAVCLTLAGACKKMTPEPRVQETTVQISIQDMQGKPLGGIPVRIYDEAGYERFREEPDTKPLEILTATAEGMIVYRFPARLWLSGGPRLLHFVIYERLDEKNFQTWAVGRTIGAKTTEQIDFQVDLYPVAAADEDLTGTAIDLYDELNGRTMLAKSAYLDSRRYLCGGNRYSFADAGPVSGLAAVGEARIDGFADRLPIQPGRGYFMYKDIAMMEFPSGKWGVSIATEYAKIYVAEWIFADKKVLGARIRYSTHKPTGHGLPEWEQPYDVRLSGEKTATISFPGAGACEFSTKRTDLLTMEVAGDQVTLRVTDDKATVGKEYPLYIRSGCFYTETKIRVTD